MKDVPRHVTIIVAGLLVMTAFAVWVGFRHTAQS